MFKSEQEQYNTIRYLNGQNSELHSKSSVLGTNMYTYLKFGLPRVLPPGKSYRTVKLVDDSLKSHNCCVPSLGIHL